MIPNNTSEAVEKLKNVDRFDPWHLESNEFTEEDHIAIQEVIEWLQGKSEGANTDIEELIKKIAVVYQLANTVALHDLEEAFTYLRRYAKIESAAEEFGYSDGQIEDFCHFASQVMDILKKE